MNFEIIRLNEFFFDSILVSNDDVLNVAVVANGDEVIELDMSVDEEPTSQTRRRSSS